MENGFVRLVCLSDTHLAQPNLPEGDLLLHCGDYSSRGSVQEAVSFLTWLDKNKSKFKKIVFINGNHDRFSQISPQTFKQLIPPDIVCLEDSLLEFEGLKIWGSPWTPTFYKWAWMKDRGNEINEKWKLIPENIDILITHGPPMNILDRAPRNFLETEFENVGCFDLKEHVLKRIKPRFHLYGHIHYEGGKNITVGNTNFYNVAIMDESYNPENPVTVIEI